MTINWKRGKWLVVGIEGDREFFDLWVVVGSDFKPTEKRILQDGCHWPSQTIQNGALTHVSGILWNLPAGGLTTPKLQLCNYHLKKGEIVSTQPWKTWDRIRIYPVRSTIAQHVSSEGKKDPEIKISKARWYRTDTLTCWRNPNPTWGYWYCYR